MPDNPWRCSECGTINEPVANSCRTCGKWPSLFDLQDSVVDEVDVEEATVGVYAERPDRVEHHEHDHVGRSVTGELEAHSDPVAPVGERRIERYEREVVVPAEEAEEGEEGDEEVSRRRSILSYLVPLAFVVYLVLSVIFSNR